MPPKVKYSKEMFIHAAIEIVREKGMAAVTARELGNKLGCSSRPVFTAFQNMEEVQHEVILEAKKRLDSYLGIAEGFELEFKKIGMQMIKFAIEEPNLFKIVFTDEKPEPRSFEELKKDLGRFYEYSIEVCMKDYGLDKAGAERLFERLWIHSYGIGMLCATRMCVFTEEEIAAKLGEEFYATILLIKSGRLSEYEYTQKPIKKEN